MADPAFMQTLGPLAAVIHDDAAVTYGVWADLKLAYLSPTWFEFAARNNGVKVHTEWQLGRSIADAWVPPLTDFYEALFKRAIAGSQPISHDFDCASAQTHRRFRLTIYPMAAHAGALAVNSLLIEEPHAPPSPQAMGLPHASYVAPNGFITQCMHCRRTRMAVDTQRWDWVPQLVEHMPQQITHGLCPICCEYYYPA